VLDQRVPQVRDHSLDLRTPDNRSNLHPERLSRHNSSNLSNTLNNSPPRVSLDLVKVRPRIQLLPPQAHNLRWVQRLLLA